MWTGELKMPILLPNGTLIGGNRVIDVASSFSVAQSYSCATFDKTNTCNQDHRRLIRSDNWLIYIWLHLWAIPNPSSPYSTDTV